LVGADVSDASAYDLATALERLGKSTSDVVELRGIVEELRGLVRLHPTSAYAYLLAANLVTLKARVSDAAEWRAIGKELRRLATDFPNSQVAKLAGSAP
jgi:hypothetical protein